MLICIVYARLFCWGWGGGVRVGGGVADVTLGSSEGYGAPGCPEYNYAARGCVGAEGGGGGGG